MDRRIDGARPSLGIRTLALLSLLDAGAIEVGYRRLRGRDGIGRGDAKLLGGLGVWTGWMGLAPIMLAASASALIGVIALAVTGIHKADADTAIPFGPFIALGGWVVWLGAPYLLPAGVY